MNKKYQPAGVLKDRAKGHLNGKYKGAVGLSAAQAGLTYVILMIILNVNQGISLAFLKSANRSIAMAVLEILITSVISWVASLFITVFTIGVNFYYLKMGAGHRPAVSDAFSVFREDASKNFKAAAIMALPGAIAILPYSVAVELYSYTKDLKYIFIALALFGLANLIIVFFSLSFKLVYFILADFPEYTAEEALAAGWKKMNGQRWRLLGFELTFIPLYLLAGFSIVGLFWFMPYYFESIAQFYLDLMSPAASE